MLTKLYELNKRRTGTQGWLKYVGLALALSLPQVQAQSEVPNPLTLDYVLSLPAEMNPDFMRQQARVLYAQAARAENQAQDRINIGLMGRLGQREFRNQAEGYNQAAIHLDWPLYDFGRTRLTDQAWQRDQQAQEHKMQSIAQQYRLILMQAYFNVLLADLNFRVENEAMAIAFVTLDKVQEDHALSRVSDAVLYEYELAYQQAFVKRQRAQSDLRRSRMLLANAMGMPEQVISRIQIPHDLPVPDQLLRVEAYLTQAVHSNPELISAQQQVEASQYRVESARAGMKPNISAQAWAGHLSDYPEIREGNWHAQIKLDMPLYDGGLTRARTDRERAQRQQALADLRATELSLREEVTNLYFKLSLLSVERDQVNALETFADFNLDLKQALYENELQSDLGDAMVKISESEFQSLAFQLRQAYLWAQMQSLLGVEDISDFHQQQQMKEVSQ